MDKPTASLARIAPGHYQAGTITIRGIRATSNGRDGASYTRWLVYKAGDLVSTHPTLARAKEAI